MAGVGFIRPLESPGLQARNGGAFDADVARADEPRGAAGRRDGDGPALGFGTGGRDAVAGVNGLQAGVEMVERAFQRQGETRRGGFRVFDDGRRAVHRRSAQIEEWFEAGPLGVQERGSLLARQSARGFFQQGKIRRGQTGRHGLDRRGVPGRPQEPGAAAGGQHAGAFRPLHAQFQRFVGQETRTQRRAQRRGVDPQRTGAAERDAPVSGESIEQRKESRAVHEGHASGNSLRRGGDGFDNAEVFGQKSARRAGGVEHRAVAAGGDFEADEELALRPRGGEVGCEDDVKARGGVRIGLERQRDGRGFRGRAGFARGRDGRRGWVHPGQDRQPDRDGMRADRPVFARRAAGAEVFDVGRRLDLEAGAVFAVAFPDHPL